MIQSTSDATIFRIMKDPRKGVIDTRIQLPPLRSFYSHGSKKPDLFFTEKHHVDSEAMVALNF